MTSKILINAIKLTFFAMFFSCEKEIELKFDGDDKKLVVNSIICPDSLITVKVAYSQLILENQPTNYVTTATVLLFENGVLLDNLVLVANGKYQSKFKPQTNKIYYLEVSDGKNIITATCHVPEKPLKFHAVADTTYDQVGFPYLGVNIVLDDKGEQKNFYRIILTGPIPNPNDIEYFRSYIFSYNDEALNNQTSPLDAINDYITSDPHNFNRKNLVFSDISFNGSSREIKLSEIHTNTKAIYVHLHALSEDYYKYLCSINNKPDDNFSDPLAIHSNINNGFGLFAAYNDLVDTVYR